MEKEFIPCEQALDLRELEFDELCICIYNREKALRANVFNNSNDRFKSVQLSYNNGKIPAPLYQQAFRWFRDKYGYFQLFDYQHGDSKINKGFFFNIININNEDFFFPEDFENEIYKQYTIYEVKDSYTDEPQFEVREEKDEIDGTKDFEGIKDTNG